MRIECMLDRSCVYVYVCVYMCAYMCVFVLVCSCAAAVLAGTAAFLSVIEISERVIYHVHYLINYIQISKIDVGLTGSSCACAIFCFTTFNASVSALRKCFS